MIQAVLYIKQDVRVRYERHRYKRRNVCCFEDRVDEALHDSLDPLVDVLGEGRSAGIAVQGFRFRV